MGATPSLRASDDLPRQELLFVEQSLPDFLTFNFRDRLHVKNALPPWGYVVAWRVRQRETSGSHEAESIAACEVEAILNGATGPADCCYLVLVFGQPIVKVPEVLHSRHYSNLETWFSETITPNSVVYEDFLSEWLSVPDSQVRFSLFLWDGLEASSQTKAVTSCHALELYEHISKGVHPRALVVWGEAGKPLDLTDTSEPALCSESDNAFLNYVCTVTGDARRTCDFYWSNENVRLFPYSSQLQGVHPSCSAAVDTPSSPPKTKLPVPLLKGLESLGRTSLGIGSLASARRPSYRGSATPTASESDSSVSGQYTFDGESESCSADAALQSPTPAVKVPFSLKLPKLPKLDADLSSPHSPSKRDSPVSLQGRASKRSCRSPVSLHVDSPAPRSARSAAFSQLGSLLLKYQDCVNAEQVMSREDLLEIYRPILSRIVPRLRLCSALMASSASANAVICPDVLVNLAADVVVPFFPHTRHLNLYLEDSRLCADKLEAVLYSLTVYLDSVVGATAEPPDRSSDPASLLTELYQSVSADSFGSPGGATVFCREGVSRSATVVIAYLMWRFKWQYRRALEFVRASREVVNPNLGFVMTLLRFEKSLKHPECVRYVAKAVTHHELSPFFTSVRELNFDSSSGSWVTTEGVMQPRLDSRLHYLIRNGAEFYWWKGPLAPAELDASVEALVLEEARLVQEIEGLQVSVTTTSYGSEPDDLLDALGVNTSQELLALPGSRLYVGHAKDVERYLVAKGMEFYPFCPDVRVPSLTRVVMAPNIDITFGSLSEVLAALGDAARVLRTGRPHLIEVDEEDGSKRYILLGSAVEVAKPPEKPQRVVKVYHYPDPEPYEEEPDYEDFYSDDLVVLIESDKAMERVWVWQGDDWSGDAENVKCFVCQLSQSADVRWEHEHQESADFARLV